MAILRFLIENMKKILQKVCTKENNAYLCIRNQEISSSNSENETSVNQMVFKQK